MANPGRAGESSTHPMKLLRTIAALSSLSLALLVPPSTSAATLGLTETGVTIDNGPDAKFILEYPTLLDAAKKSTKVAERSLSANAATLKFAGGGQLDVSLGNGEIILNTSRLPEGTQMMASSIRIGSEYAGAGKWDAGKGEVNFPAEKSTQNIYQGSAKVVTLISPAAIHTAFQMPDHTFQQIQDGRQWNLSYFAWKAWIPLLPGVDHYTISVGNTAPSPASAAAAAPPVSAPVPAKAPAKPGTTPADTVIFKWKDGKQGVFMMSFDDSCPSHLKNVIPELTKRKMIGTFYIVTGGPVYQNQKGSWEKAAANPYVVLANHTYTHKGVQDAEDLDQEISKCNESIYACYPDRKNPRLIAFGAPGGVPWKVSKEELNAALAKYHLINRPSFYGPPFQLKTSAEMFAVVDLALKNENMSHLDFHGVGGDWHVTPMDSFTALLDKLDACRDRLWITDPVSWHQYETERKTAAVKTVQSTPREIRLQLSSQADPSFYDLPLSLATRVPAAWKACTITQATLKTKVAVADGQVNYEAIPGAGEIILQATDTP